MGLVVHPAVGHPDGTLVNALLHRFGRLQAGDDPLRPGIVHRLDRDTSGLLVIALTDESHRHLGAQIEARQVGRVYMALSWGKWPAASGRLTGAIGRHPRFRQKMAVVERGGREAATRYEVVEEFGFAELCRVELETGRTHQIRVHFAYNGHPVVGDALYGEDKRARGIHKIRPSAGRSCTVRAATRQMLHAAELRLAHPLTGQEMAFQGPAAGGHGPGAGRGPCGRGPSAGDRQARGSRKGGHPAAGGLCSGTRILGRRGARRRAC